MIRTVTLPLAVLLLTGCFGSKYESRLEETGRWYGYLDELDRNLGPAWAGGSAVYFRPPNGFKLKFDEETKEPFSPPFLESDIEGLRATWTSTVSVDGEQATAYLFLADNHELWLKPTTRSPHPALKFLERFRLSFNRQFNPDDTKSVARVLPEVGRFGPTRSFEVVRTRLGTPIDGHVYDATWAEYDANNVQGVLLMLVPSESGSVSQMGTGFDFAVESLEFLERPPKPRPEGSKRPGGGNQPSGGGPGGLDF